MKQELSFKSATELGITKQEHEVLEHVYHMLKRGELVWHGDKCEDEFYDSCESLKMFNMGTIFRQGDCATVGCIGGWMAMSMGMRDRWDIVDFVNNKMSPALHLLCFPERGDFSKIRPEHAIEAIENFFRLGFPRWDDVLYRARVRDEEWKITGDRLPIRMEFGEPEAEFVEIKRLGESQKALADAQRQALEDMRPEQVCLPSEVQER